jgi:hypothetical protein
VARRYRIPDEPSPGPLAKSIAVQPFWPLLSVMFSGVWLSWPWFIINGIAIGSPSRKKELAVALTGFVVKVALVFGLSGLYRAGVLDDGTIRYAVLIPLVWMLGVTYWLYVLQSRTFAIYEYYGGVVNNGIIFLLGGMFIGNFVFLRLVNIFPLARLIFG